MAARYSGVVTEVPAPPAVSLRLLGPPSLLAGGRERPLAAERPQLLLAYLAARRDWVRRDALAELLYPGRELDGARSNLRKLLFLARKLDGVGEIEQRGELLRWAPATDLQRFEAACDARRWADALAAYGGPLLLGLDAAWPAGGGDWLEAERQRLQARWHEACTRRLAELAGDPDAARTLAEAMLREDPLDDTALEALGRAQQALGQADAALVSLADYARRLAQETGLAPSAALEALGAELRSAAPPAPPPPAPGFVGRRQERRQVLERLAQPECRVLTLLGPPGVGKSALLRALLPDLQGTWVALEALVQADEVPARIAHALGLALDGALPPWQALARALAARPAVLLLDQPDHLALADGLAGLLAAAPGVRVLAAARAPLGVAGEWRLPLEGLPLPDRDESDPEVLAANDAVQLFVQRARPLAPAFELAAEAADVVRLVHEVDGLPLALELLAAWRRLMPVSEILAELSASLDVLEPSMPGERSVRAGFAKSWQQLGPVEQRVLSQLALLPSPVDRELVRGTLQAPLPVLAALADRSLLRADGDGRFSLHPLIRRLAAPLAADAEALHERHARHVARRLGGERTVGDDELPHVRAAWRWAVDHDDIALQQALRVPLARTLLRLALPREAVEAMREHVAALRRHGGPPAPLAAALAQLAASHYQCGALDEALQAAQRAEPLALAAADIHTASWAASRAGAVHWQRGELPAARSAFARQLAHVAGLPEDDPRRATALSWVALIDKAEGRFDDAQRGYEEAARLLRAAGTLHGSLYLVNNLGNLLRVRGRGAEALAVLNEGLQLARQHGSREDEPFLLTNIALVHEDQGAPEAALQWADRAVASAAEHGEPMIEISARGLRARCTAALRRQVAPALPDLWTAFTVAAQVDSPSLLAGVMVDAGLTLAHAGRRAAGFALLRHGLASPAMGPADHSEADAKLQALQPTAAELAEAATLLAPDATRDDALALLRRAAQGEAPA